MMILIESYRLSQCIGVGLEHCYYPQGGQATWWLYELFKCKTQDIIPLFCDETKYLSP